ncbi:RagB/SusD family nutrient uptake outer membrane protein [Flavobacterium pectinovorum]|uniref:RagB/SusD family nutrient uptake outer membrane protein n=1 Tax=Flavobacterium pectinovorum TaxID=29533 RepID=A0A502F656_9FLAO|nr:RagB/SusD family nutrient uptake outer membrane protein [Flavobacterium pectinovorum]TPG44166.1 RagB/SusD family nutrient uptake outer membrane protein [Flavobacterium pectinovorum]
MNQNTIISKKLDRNILSALMITISFFTLFSCDSFVDIEEPNSQLTTDAVFESKATATAAMTDIYAQMRDNGIITGKLAGISNLMGNYTDELVAYENGAYSSEPFYNNSVLPSNALILSQWNASYNQIYAANAVLGGLDNSTVLTAGDKNQLKGEALFVRVLNHFYLVNLFGSVPYVTSTDYKVNSTITRIPISEVYSKIIEDLLTSVDLLSQDYVTSERVRPNKSTAQALLARVYLYTQQWDKASNMASAVLNNQSLYVWENDLDAVFLKESTATIWQLSPDYNGKNTHEGAAFIFPSAAPSLVALSNTLLESFAANDLRKSHWIKAVTDGTDIWYHSYKYKEDSDTGSSVEYSIVFRTAEQYLIRAEARAHQGNLIGAKEDLNKIRNTAGLPNSDAVTADQIIDAVIQERRFELFTEYGHRFFDLKRTGKLDSALNYKTGWNSTDSLWPLPQSELLTNPFLTPQNPGY